ncbi:MAG: pyridoxamine 5'-phosphate oxidase [Sphingobacteriaceae bacterium]|nr:MAG: pyridoxamine 5'-phosphate oxidase [Pedobacter sp.]
MDKKKVENLRQNYEFVGLSEDTIAHNPIQQFDVWFEDALKADLYEPNAMTLATSSIDGRPAARIVLLKGFDENGFVFYTNYLSAKGKAIDQNSQVALVFFWAELARQVRVEGIVKKLNEQTAENYFHSRPRGSQIGALASPQGQVLINRHQLEKTWRDLEQQYQDKPIPKPAYWGGYLVKPKRMEFWQGRENRLHDRILYEKTSDKNWKISRLAP